MLNSHHHRCWNEKLSSKIKRNTTTTIITIKNQQHKTISTIRIQVSEHSMRRESVRFCANACANLEKDKPNLSIVWSRKLKMHALNKLKKAPHFPARIALISIYFNMIWQEIPVHRRPLTKKHQMLQQPVMEMQLHNMHQCYRYFTCSAVCRLKCTGLFCCWHTINSSIAVDSTIRKTTFKIWNVDKMCVSVA